MTASWTQEEFSTCDLKDSRLNKRAEKIVDSLSANPGLSINGACQSWGETIAAYRFIDNKYVTPQALLQPHKDATIKRVKKEKVVLMVQDTTQFSYYSREKITDMGPTYGKTTQGFFLHPTIAITPSRVCLGTVEHKIWTRKKLGARKHKKKKTIDKKESYKWLESVRTSNEISEACPNTLIINVSDREGDIYDVYQEAHSYSNKNHHWLVRCAHDRKLKNSDDTMLEAVKNTKPIGTVTFEVPRTPTRKKRIIKQQIRVGKYTVKPPVRQAKTDLYPIEVTVVHCLEKKPPKGEAPLEWIFVTSLPVTDEDSAKQIMDYYLCRWEIEIFFKILKSGCGVEKLQLEKQSRFNNCVALYMIVAWRILHITMIGRQKPSISCEVVFEKSEWMAAYQIATTKKLPTKPPTLGKLINIIAGFGGYLNRKSDPPPGPKTMWIGMQRLMSFTLAWEEFMHRFKGQICV